MYFIDEIYFWELDIKVQYLKCVIWNREMKLPLVAVYRN